MRERFLSPSPSASFALQSQVVRDRKGTERKMKKE